MIIKLNAPQIIILALYIIALFSAALQHGQEKRGTMKKYNFWSSLGVFIIAIAVLIWGGFFTTCNCA